MLKKITSLLLVLAMTGLLMVGCGQAGEKPAEQEQKKEQSKTEDAKVDSKKEVKISFGYTGGDPLLKQIISERVAAFVKKNPNIKIDEQSSGSGTYLDFLKTKDAVGEFPDLVETRETAIWQRAGRLAVMPEELTSLVENPPLLDGKCYTIPYSGANTNGIFYNAKMFKEHGLNEPKTYAEFLDVCEKLKAKKIAPLVLGAKDGFHIGFLWGKYWIDEVTAKNPNWISDRYKGKVKFLDANVVAALQKYIDLVKKGYVEPGYISTADNQIASILVSGKAAMFYSGTHMFKQIKDADPNFEFGWFALPDTDGKINLLAGSQNQGWSYSVNCEKDPDKKAAAIAWIKFWFEKENYVDYLQKMSAFPVTKEKVDIQYPIAGMDKVLQAVNNANFKDLNWNMKWGENEIPPQFRNFAYKAVQECMVGKTTVEDLCKKLDTEWDVQMKDFNPTVNK